MAGFPGYTKARMSIVSITGHRNLSQSDITTISLTMTSLMADETIEAIYFGGAKGADTEALRACLDIRKSLSVQLVVVVPDRVEDQPRVARDWIFRADQVIELGNPITPMDHYRSYSLRNEYLVDVVRETDGFLVAFWDGIESGGTYNCLEYARMSDIPIQVVGVEGPRRKSN